jgi:nicotinate-nucleotide adenylyltransferase
MDQPEFQAQTQTTYVYERKRQIGILGGNFNPIHNGHLLIADQAQQILDLDMVYLMPEYLPPHIDKKETIDPKDRLAMVGLAIKGNPRLGIELIELNHKRMSYTYETMSSLIKKNPDVDYYFILGGDMVEYLPKWHKIQELAQLIRFVGIERTGFARKPHYPVIWIDVPKIDISSTRIRKMIAKGLDPRYLIPDIVLHYIKKKGLYLE